MKLTRRATGLQETLFDMAMEYIQAGVLYEADRNGRLKAFGMGTVGVTHYNPKERGRASEWRLSAGFGVGGKSFVSERVAIRTSETHVYTDKRRGKHLLRQRWMSCQRAGDGRGRAPAHRGADVQVG